MNYSYKISYLTTDSLKDVKPTIEIKYPDEPHKNEEKTTLATLDETTKLTIQMIFLTLKFSGKINTMDKVLYYKSNQPLVGVYNNPEIYNNTSLRIDIENQNQNQNSYFSRFSSYFPPPMFTAGYILGLIAPPIFTAGYILGLIVEGLFFINKNNNKLKIQLN